MVKHMIKGCGVELKCGFCCGDSIDCGHFDEDGNEYVQPIYCKKCWEKVNAMDKVGALD